MSAQKTVLQGNITITKVVRHTQVFPITCLTSCCGELFVLPKNVFFFSPRVQAFTAILLWHLIMTWQLGIFHTIYIGCEVVHSCLLVEMMM